MARSHMPDPDPNPIRAQAKWPTSLEPRFPKDEEEVEAEDMKATNRHTHLRWTN